MYALPRDRACAERLDAPALPRLPLAQLVNLPVVTSQG